MNKVSGWESLLNTAEKERDEARGALARMLAQADDWIARGHTPQCAPGSGPCEKCAKSSAGVVLYSVAGVRR